MSPPVAHVLVAHGTRKQSGVALIGDLAQRVSAAVGAGVHVAFVDVLGPTPSEVLRGLTAPAVVVPAFLSRGYHVNTDIPRQADIPTSSSPMRSVQACSSHEYWPNDSSNVVGIQETRLFLRRRERRTPTPNPI
jgi:sirohydrochlorin ferrochelatase